MKPTDAEWGTADTLSECTCDSLDPKNCPEVRRIAQALADARVEGVIEGLNQARGIVKYELTVRANPPAAVGVLENVDVFLQANIGRGGRDGYAEVMEGRADEP